MFTEVPESQSADWFLSADVVKSVSQNASEHTQYCGVFEVNSCQKCESTERTWFLSADMVTSAEDFESLPMWSNR